MRFDDHGSQSLSIELLVEQRQVSFGWQGDGVAKRNKQEMHGLDLSIVTFNV